MTTIRKRRAASGSTSPGSAGKRKRASRPRNDASSGKVRLTFPLEVPTVRLRFQVYEILSRAVEAGAVLGVNRAYKHTRAPAREEISSAVYQAVMNELAQIVNFEDEEDGS